MMREIIRNHGQQSSLIPSIRNEYSTLTKVLVVSPPEKFTRFNNQIINPISDINSKGKPEITEHPEQKEEFDGLLNALQQQGIELHFSNVRPSRPGHTPLFTRDIGIIISNQVLPSRMANTYRENEVEGVFQNISLPQIIRDNRDYKIEGGDFALLEPNLALVGIGPRTNELGLRVLQEYFPKIEFIPVYPVLNEKAFHIDTVMGIVGNKILLGISDLIQKNVSDLLKSRGYQIIEADKDEYFTCATNVLAIDDRKVIAAAENPKTNEKLRKVGVEVIEVKLSGILKRGGGPHCLTLPLERAS
ncbi:MAG TPA: arginine deiminase family protein [Candidatus Woesebacteria bacterium]|nr:arginine deiminase family protein [Candidatus Woesebacteria bacterium]